ncbi:uncharacterized protein UTRI_00271 [Ustilago trichophora]|uniref:Uncharacterized protein n=1 Tax=Ustilago trichophora TaxID=86804 RepID=A0A5C3DQY0_9BASI|nr:uncharacterized protein UTRI_00271 [Ustilago trichophora]
MPANELKWQRPRTADLRLNLVAPTLLRLPLKLGKISVPSSFDFSHCPTPSLSFSLKKQLPMKSAIFAIFAKGRKVQLEGRPWIGSGRVNTCRLWMETGTTMMRIVSRLYTDRTACGMPKIILCNLKAAAPVAWHARPRLFRGVEKLSGHT